MHGLISLSNLPQIQLTEQGCGDSAAAWWSHPGRWHHHCHLSYWRQWSKFPGWPKTIINLGWLIFPTQITFLISNNKSKWQDQRTYAASHRSCSPRPEEANQGAISAMIITVLCLFAQCGWWVFAALTVRNYRALSSGQTEEAVWQAFTIVTDCSRYK